MNMPARVDPRLDSRPDVHLWVRGVPIGKYRDVAVENSLRYPVAAARSRFSLDESESIIVAVEEKMAITIGELLENNDNRFSRQARWVYKRLTRDQVHSECYQGERRPTRYES